MDPAGQICYVDAYARSVEAIVLAVDSGAELPLVVLDRTVFYPGGGGQPSDRGVILRGGDGRSWTVRGAKKSGGDIVHELESADAGLPSVGDVVTADLEWARRHSLMRTHTALHALCGVVWRDYGALVTGGNMEPGAGRMDFEFERMSGDLVDEIEAKVNAELAAARHPGDSNDRNRRARPAGRWRNARRQHAGSRANPRPGLRIEGPDQQAHPNRGRGRTVTTRRR
jgi:misacylated tRNA(Ala) deacylase